MRRFFVDPSLLRGSSGVISGELCRHLVTVLRLAAGEKVTLADGEGGEAVATITAVTPEGVHVDLMPCQAVPSSAATPAITVYQALPKGDKLDLVLQKCTELGAAAIVPFMAERSVTRLEGERLEKRVARWQKIAQEAARQSGRGTVPRVGFAADLAGVLRGGSHDLCLMLWEEETEQGLRGVLERADRPASIAVIIGPEGGLTPAEAALAKGAGYLPVTLGSRILRTETAGLAVVSILQYLWGDLG